MQRTREKHVGDLTALIGTPKSREGPAWSIARPGLPAAGQDRGQARPGQAVHHALPRHCDTQLPGRTVFIFDSFGTALMGAFQPYLHETASALWYATPPTDVIKLIAGADTVILEKVEREINYLASDLGVITPKFLADLERALARG